MPSARTSSLIEHLKCSRQVKRLEERLRDLGQVKNEVDYVSEEAVYGQVARAQQAELALPGLSKRCRLLETL